MTRIVVIGFYTPDYAPLADRLSANLSAFGVASKFYPHSVDGGWDRQLMAKPGIARKALADFPDCAVVLMDVDCIIRVAIDTIADFDADIALHQRVKINGRRTSAWSSSRVVVFQQTPVAYKLAESWLNLCAAASHAVSKTPLDDEHLLSKAISTTPFLRVMTLPDTYAAHEIDEAPDDAVIVHQSAHAEQRHAWALQRSLKAARRRVIGAVVGKPYKQWKYGGLGPNKT